MNLCSEFLPMIKVTEKIVTNMAKIPGRKEITITTFSETQFIAQAPYEAPKANRTKVINDCFATSGANGIKAQNTGIEKTSKAISEKLETNSTKKKFETNNDMAEMIRGAAQISRKTIRARVNAMKNKKTFIKNKLTK